MTQRAVEAFDVIGFSRCLTDRAMALQGDDLFFSPQTHVFSFVTTEGPAQMRAKATEAGAKFLITKHVTAETFSKVLAPYIKD